jgi:3-oxoacyl-[acyl-carrier protein] reductase
MVSVSPLQDKLSSPEDGLFDTPPKFASFETIQPGDEVQFSKTITGEDLEAFAKLSGDRNPLHMDERFAARTHFQRRVVHGMLLANYVSGLVGMRCPGPGALWTQQTFRWRAPVFINDRVLVSLRVKHKSVASRLLTIEVQVDNQNGRVVMDGEGVVTALEESRNLRDLSISDRVAYVSIGSREMGATICTALADAGIAVVVGHHEDNLAAEEVCSAIRRKGGRAMHVRADANQRSSIVAALQQAQDYFRHSVNILINNAGIPPEPQPFVETPWEHMQSVFDAHLREAYQNSQAVIPGMMEQKWGRIINLGSSFARSTPPPNWSAFVLAKAALQAMTRCLAVELGPHGICVNTVAPGLIDTESIEGLSERAKKLQAMQTPLRRLASPADVAAAIVALCGDAGRFVTGAEIPVCGGLQM